VAQSATLFTRCTSASGSLLVVTDLESQVADLIPDATINASIPHFYRFFAISLTGVEPRCTV